MTIATAISTMKLHIASRGELDNALAVMLEEVQRYRECLKWYADPRNWIDGNPGSFDEQNQWQEDEGLQAKIALRLIDAAGLPIAIPPKQAPAPPIAEV